MINDTTSQMNQFYAQSETVNDIAKYITWGQYFYYGISIILCVLAFISFLFLCKFVYCARYFLHFVWCLFGILMILGFLLTAVLYPTNGMLVEVCDYSQKLLTVKDALES